MAEDLKIKKEDSKALKLLTESENMHLGINGISDAIRVIIKKHNALVEHLKQ